MTVFSSFQQKDTYLEGPICLMVTVICLMIVTKNVKKMDQVTWVPTYECNDLQPDF